MSETRTIDIRIKRDGAISHEIMGVKGWQP